MNNRVYTGSGTGTIQERQGNILVVRLDDPRGGKLFRSYPENETLPMETLAASEKNFRKQWGKQNSFSWCNPQTGNRGVMILGEIYDRMGK
jgi:hypothetical protein